MFEELGPIAVVLRRIQEKHNPIQSTFLWSESLVPDDTLKRYRTLHHVTKRYAWRSHFLRGASELGHFRVSVEVKLSDKAP